MTERANYIPSLAMVKLNRACVSVMAAFPVGGLGVFLVGSSIARRDYRDVDVRCILTDAEFDRLFRGPPNGPNDDGQGYHNALWSLMCTSISAHLSDCTGLPIDFQIQRQTQANVKHSGRRQALGAFLDYPGERPGDMHP